MAMLRAKINSGVSSSIGSPGGAVTSITEGFKCREEIRIGTWNVKTMNQGGKIHNAIQEMTRLNLNFLGVSEMRWPGTGSVNIQDHQVFYSGTDNGKHEYGVGLILTKEIAKCVDNFIPVSCRVMLVQIKAKPVDLNIIQVYAPTSDATEEEIEDFYSSLNQVLKKLKKQDILIIMGDFNAKLGAGKTSQSVGPFGLGNRNPRGDELETFAVTNQLAVMNTWFKLHPRRLYTWKSPMDKPGKIVRNQIDYILISKRYRNAITSVKTYPGADIQSDHVPLVATFKVKLKRITTKNMKMYDLRKLKDPHSKQTAKQILNETMRNIEEKNTVKEKLEIVQRTCKEIKEKCLKKDVRKKKTWMTDEILNLMDQRRGYKNRDEIRYNNLNKEIRRKIREAKSLWIEGRCKEIEELERKHDSFNLHKKVKEMTNLNRKPRTGNLIDEQGNLVVQEEEKIKVWEKYVTELFTDRRDEYALSNIESGIEISMAEIERAIQKAKNKKACGPDEIPAEFLKMLQANGKQYLLQMFNQSSMKLELYQKTG
uniref:Craniofacial development protein 2 n=1 Tax=Cacopsylla melanoneura TaxID=428564 RepID=A0A8D8ZLR6_9HEMI